MIKFIVTKHLDSYLFEGSKGNNSLISGIFLEKIIFNQADHIIFISKQVKRYFLKSIKISDKKTSVIYYGCQVLKIKRKKNILKKKFNLKKKDILLCTIARHINQKNLFFLLKVFEKLLNKKKINARLLLIGSGPDTFKLKSFAKKLKIYHNIIWINYCENIRAVLQGIDIFCLPSNYEGLGLVLLEAMAEKKPIIATNISAIPEVIKNNYNGLLFEKNNEYEFLKCIEKIIYNKRIRIKLINNGLKVLKKKFPINKMIKKTNKVYFMK